MDEVHVTDIPDVLPPLIEKWITEYFPDGLKSNKNFIKNVTELCGWYWLERKDYKEDRKAIDEKKHLRKGQKGYKNYIDDLENINDELANVRMRLIWNRVIHKTKKGQQFPLIK